MNPAGFIDHSTGRFVKPGNVSGHSEVSEPPTPPHEGGGGGSGGGNIPQHPLVIGLFQSLPADGTTWNLDDALAWMEAAAVNLRIAYKFKGTITVTASLPKVAALASGHTVEHPRQDG